MRRRAFLALALLGTATRARAAESYPDVLPGKTLRKVIRMLGSLEGPAYNLVLHTAPLHENVRETFHWHWEIHPRLREIGGLELGTGLPVNPISPEEAVDELLASTRAASGASADRDEPEPGRTWDDFRRR